MDDLTQWYDEHGALYTHESDADYGNQVAAIEAGKPLQPVKIAVPVFLAEQAAAEAAAPPLELEPPQP